MFDPYQLVDIYEQVISAEKALVGDIRMNCDLTE